MADRPAGPSTGATVTAAAREWEPGDPLPTREWVPGEPFMPDNGSGTVPDVSWDDDAKQAAIAEDPTPPPWYRPTEATTAVGMVRSCRTCGVQWRGDQPCWMCGGDHHP